MRDVRDWNKYVDLLGKSVVRRSAPPDAAPARPDFAAVPSGGGSPLPALPDAEPPRSRPVSVRGRRGMRREETREELLARLLDPILTLEETARILQVCPTTVRRYTNKGLLPHERSPGNQRRFRWSHVFAFMEAQAKRSGPLACE